MKKILTTALFTSFMICASAQTPIHTIKYDTVNVNKDIMYIKTETKNKVYVDLSRNKRGKRQWHWAITGFISFATACFIFDRSK